jgi:hypothetical protein
MSARPDCDHCVYRDDPATPCLALLRDDPSWCHRTNPARAIWRRGAVDELRRATLEALGRPVPSQFPPLAKRARNLAGSVARFVAAGGEIATPEERDRRMDICRGCDRFVGGMCSECGCRLGFKVAMATEHCPLDPPKW